MKKILTVSDFREQLSQSVITLMHVNEEGETVYRYVTSNLPFIRYLNKKLVSQYQGEGKDLSINGMEYTTVEKPVFKDEYRGVFATPLDLKMEVLETIFERDNADADDNDEFDYEYENIAEDVCDRYTLFDENDYHLFDAALMFENFQVDNASAHVVSVYNILTHQMENVNLLNYSGETFKTINLNSPEKDTAFLNSYLYLGNKSGPLNVSHRLVDMADKSSLDDVGIKDDDLFIQLDTCLGFREVEAGKAGVGDIYLMVTKNADNQGDA